MKKISYGFALPGLIVTATIITHVKKFAIIIPKKKKKGIEIS